MIRNTFLKIEKFDLLNGRKQITDKENQDLYTELIVNYKNFTPLSEEEKTFLLQIIDKTEHHNNIMYGLSDILGDYSKNHSLGEIFTITCHDGYLDPLKDDIFAKGDSIPNSNFFPNNIPPLEVNKFLDNIDYSQQPTPGEIDFLAYLIFRDGFLPDLETRKRLQTIFFSYKNLLNDVTYEKITDQYWTIEYEDLSEIDD